MGLLRCIVFSAVWYCVVVSLLNIKVYSVWFFLSCIVGFMIFEFIEGFFDGIFKELEEIKKENGD